MLKKANRLQSQWDFKRTLAGRKIGANDCFAVYGLVSASTAAGPFSATSPTAVSVPQPRIGFIVSKKIHKRAVQRNRIKRRLREVFRLWLLSETQRAALASYRTVVVIARSGSLGASYHHLEQRMAQCFRKR